MSERRPQEYFGIGTINSIDKILAREKPSSIILVKGKSSYHQSGAAAILSSVLKSYSVIEFSEFSSNPQWEEILSGIEVWRKKKPELVIAIGGGSSIDVAKIITILAEQSENPELYLERKKVLKPRITKLIAIPTTSGTGSEATHFAVVYNGKKKYSIAHQSLVPDYSIIDPNLTFSLSAYQTACTGMDVLVQAIESYWSIHATKESKQYAREAITLVLTHLEIAVQNPTAESRVGMAKAANYAGKAINVSFTTACHALSYPMTSYFNIPHGHAVALTLPEIITHNADISPKDCLDKRSIQYVQKIMQELYAIFKVPSALEMKHKIEELMDKIGLNRKLSAIKIKTDADLEIIIKNGFNQERMKNNPRLLNEMDVRKLLQKIR